MDCCNGIEAHFGADKVRGWIEELERDGPPEETRRLAAALEPAAVRDATVLDIGAGIGTLPQLLLAQGARHAQLVDISQVALEAAARRLGERATILHGDFLAVADRADAADIVTLDKVICCYGDMNTLIDRSAAKARRLYAASYPRAVWWVKLSIWWENTRRRIARNPFRAYVHPVRAIEDRIASHGFRLKSLAQTWFWRIVVFERVS